MAIDNDILISFPADSDDMIYRAPGKRSPDGRFQEYKNNREIARAVVEHLQLRGIDAELLVPEDNDTPLKERVRRANKITCQIGHSLSDELATCLYKAAGKHLPGHKIRPISIRCESRKEANAFVDGSKMRERQALCYSILEEQD